MRAILGAALGCTVLFASGVTAQESAAGSQPPPVRRSAPSLGVWLGLASNSPALGELGDTPGLDFALAAVQASWVVTSGPRSSLAYTVDLIPAAFLSKLEEAPEPPPCQFEEPCQLAGYGARLFRSAVYGLGLSPVGLQLSLREGERVQLHLGAGAGALWFARPVPVRTGARLNFTAHVGGGLVLARRSGAGLMLGYRFYHLSNAGLAPFNPGVANHLLLAGFRWPR